MIVITGGAGFIGSALLHHLNTQKIQDILVVDHLDASPKWKNLVGARFSDYLDRQDFLETLQAGRLPSAISTIFHLGACSRTTETDSHYLLHNNTLYTKTLTKWCLQHDVKLIYASSGATYGDGQQGYQDDVSLLDNLHPLNMYGYSKHLFDLWARDLGWFDKITGFKLFNVFGPRESHKKEMMSLVCKAFPNVNQGKPMRLFRSHRPDYADGEQCRDFIYIDDVVKVLAWAAEHPQISGLYNLGRGETVTWNQVAYTLFEACGHHPQIEYFDMPEAIRSQYQYRTCASIEKLRQAGYTTSFMSLEESLYKYVAWLKKYQ